MARPNPRRRLDQLAREAERAIEASRQAALPTDAELNDAATVRRPDVDAAGALWAEANAGHDISRLLDGPPGESERA